jgi:hypothetical protein
MRITQAGAIPITFGIAVIFTRPDGRILVPDGEPLNPVDVLRIDWKSTMMEPQISDTAA